MDFLKNGEIKAFWLYYRCSRQHAKVRPFWAIIMAYLFRCSMLLKQFDKFDMTFE